MSLFFEWFKQREMGSPMCADGYASQVVAVGETAVNVNLGRNSVYKLQAKMSSIDVDGYISVREAWNTVIGGTGAVSSMDNEADEVAVTDATGMIIRHGEDLFITTNTTRHVLSAKMPDASGVTMSLRVIKMAPGKCYNEDD